MIPATRRLASISRYRFSRSIWPWVLQTSVLSPLFSSSSSMPSRTAEKKVLLMFRQDDADGGDAVARQAPGSSLGVVLLFDDLAISARFFGDTDSG
jgi:hypothetical protein